MNKASFLHLLRNALTSIAASNESVSLCSQPGEMDVQVDTIRRQIERIQDAADKWEDDPTE